jgi:hypothetical protein
MRPGHLNVFDGLRITTEHMNYLQGSFHSAVQDLRGILGLGTVFEGFDVSVENNSVTVGPGLAFDQQKNRIALDEPVIVALSFAPDENTKYVCVKYDQLEDGEVEGHFTLVWDSCVVTLETALPDPEINLVVVARLDRGENGAVQVIRNLPADEGKSEPEAKTQSARLAVQQGVARMQAEGKSTIDLGFDPLSLTCHTIINLKIKEDTFSSTSNGEVTFAADGVSQFGVGYSKLIEDGVACLPIAQGARELLVKVEQGDGSGFVIDCSLVQRDATTAEETNKDEDQGDVFEWEALVAWKALGESRG